MNMNKKLSSIIGLCVLVMLCVGCAAKPERVVMELAEAINAKDLETALNYYAEDAIVSSVSPEPFTGKEEIRIWLEGMMADNFHLETEIVEAKDNAVTGYDTMSMDSMKFYGIETMTGTSEIAFENGKISALNFSWSEETLADLQAAPFVAREDLIGAWTVGTHMKINEDGTVRIADKIDDLAEPVSEEHPGSLGTWTYDGMVFTFQEHLESAGEEHEGLCDGQVGIYLVRWAASDGDRLRFEPIEDPCGTRNGGMQWGNWAPITP
jgi:hypothetical protein